MKERRHSSYIFTSEKDISWGMVVSSVGMQKMEAGDRYPPVEHPSRYLFSPGSGRVLKEFQLLYIVEGQGVFKSESTGRQTVKVHAGDMFLLFPDEWHSYCPDPKTGWKEYWIGFDGDIPTRWKDTGYIKPSSPAFHVGVKTELISLYEQAITLSITQESYYQQLLSSVAISILANALYFERNIKYRQDSVDSLFQKIRSDISMNLSSISPVSLAEDMGIGYSKFRKMFKEYTNMSPGKYILEMRITRAKELLTNSDLLVQEIAWEVGFENVDYFVTIFKSYTGEKPGEYRRSRRQVISKTALLP